MNLLVCCRKAFMGLSLKLVCLSFDFANLQC